jgi:hypothetical protein
MAEQSWQIDIAPRNPADRKTPSQIRPAAGIEHKIG